MDITRNKLTSEELAKIGILTNQARSAILKMTTLAKSGHPGGSMSSIDYLMVLLHLAKIDPLKPDWEARDRIITSCGHISPAVYSALALMGYFSLDNAIAEFRLLGSKFEGHVEPSVPGVEWASGNLGQGLSAACGFALAGRMKNISNHIFVLMGDGEQQKGQLCEARRFAKKYKLNNIVAFCDNNHLQIGGDIKLIMPQNIKENYISDGWNVIEIDGHDLQQIQTAIFSAVQLDNPTLIIGKTVMGKGVSFMENSEKYHGAALSEDQLEKALQEINAENNLSEYQRLRNQFRIEPSLQTSGFSYDFNSGNRRIYQEKTDNRSAWGNAISDIANLNPKGLIAVFDCDLQGSVKTKAFETVSPEKFFQSGIMEHHVATCTGAMSKDNIQVFFADFGVFGIDETYNQHRLNDINQTNLKLITTHVGLDVGEDGKTHQCIDYLGIMRNLFGFKVIIPGDPNQTDAVIRYLVNQPGNYLVPMGRSKLETIKTSDREIFYGQEYSYEYGKADLIRSGSDGAIFCMGTVVNEAVKASDLLKENNISLQVWNISSPLQLDEKALKVAAQTRLVITCEDHNINTGLGSLIIEKLALMDLSARYLKIGVEKYCDSGKAKDLYGYYMIDSKGIAKKITTFLG